MRALNSMEVETVAGGAIAEFGWTVVWQGEGGDGGAGDWDAGDFEWVGDDGIACDCDPNLGSYINGSLEMPNFEAPEPDIDPNMPIFPSPFENPPGSVWL